MSLFVMLELLAWRTLDDSRIRLAAMLIVGLFAWRTWMHHRREALSEAGGSGDSRAASRSDGKPHQGLSPRG